MRTVSLGTSGFFLTSIDGASGQNSDWSPQIQALSSDGTVVAASTITLEQLEGNGGACVLPGLLAESKRVTSAAKLSADLFSHPGAVFGRPPAVGAELEHAVCRDAVRRS
jgi:hypothetical protein